LLRHQAKLTSEDIEALRKLRDMVSRLSTEELRVFAYVWDNISVGEIVFERDLSRIYSVRKPLLVAMEMREKGLIERGEGCYNLPRWIRRLRLKIGRFDELRVLLDRIH
jgi:hypothetical protein